jgi:hypothetical protein
VAVSFPDVIGDYIEAPQRFNTGGLQYAGYFEPDSIAPEQVANLYLFLQNTLNVPLKVGISVVVPQSGGFLKAKHPMLAVDSPEIEVSLAAAEVGLLTLPVTTTEYTESGQQALVIEPKVSTDGRGERVRPNKSKSQLDTSLIDSPVGLNLVGSVGATYVENAVKKGSFELKVRGQPSPPDRALKMQHNYETIWERKEAEFLNKAVREINLREVKLNNELTVEAIYANLYGESTERFADVGVPLRIGEAIVMAKALTYSSQYFLSDPVRRNGLLVPIWAEALAGDIDTTNSLEVIRKVGFHHLLRLAVATSFGLIAQAFQRQYWSRQERLAVANHIANHVEVGQSLDSDFLYLPLLMAGTQICSKVKLSGEDVSHTLALIKKARKARVGLFADQEMEQADKIFNHILKNAR